MKDISKNIITQKRSNNHVSKNQKSQPWKLKNSKKRKKDSITPSQAKDSEQTLLTVRLLKKYPIAVLEKEVKAAAEFEF